MYPPQFSQSLRRLWAMEKFSYSLRVFLALASTMGFCWSSGQLDLIIPLFLGITASALSETDDSWVGRSQALGVTLVCFGIAAVAVEFLFPYPFFFALGLACSAFALVMLGALGERYATIASATLILSIYTMITVDQRGGETLHYWHEPLLLVLGAAWYGLLSVVWSALFVHQPIEQGLARAYRELGRYFRLKALLFEPRRHQPIEKRRLNLVQQSSQTVVAMNAAREILLHRLHIGRTDRAISQYLKLYFLARDLHERVSSSHYPYQALTETFFHSDILFRCYRVLKLQARACQDLADSILMRQPFQYPEDNKQALGEIKESLEYLQQQQNPAWRNLLRSLRALTRNLERVQNYLSATGDSSKETRPDEQTLVSVQAASPMQILERLQSQLTPDSPVFRHAIRMVVALLCGYLTLHAIHPDHGYWILLTTVFVCQPSYGATRAKLTKRISGTIIGLLVGWILLILFPAPHYQALFAVVAGVTFFTTRTSHYTVATAAITLLVLLCFNQVGDGYDLILPRLFDTLLGCLIAVSAVFLVLPDWQGRRLDQVAANAIQCNQLYLQQLMTHYGIGQADAVNYRLVRRNAYNAEAALSANISNMLQEPEPFRHDAEAGLRFLTHANTLLNYLSALGAQREEIQRETLQLDLLQEAYYYLDSSLKSLADDLRQHRAPVSFDAQETALLQRLEQAFSEDMDDPQRLVYNQLALIVQQLGQLRNAIQPLTRAEQHAGSKL